jgi:5-methylcytosine-specific restriction endonuclease McrA
MAALAWREQEVPALLALGWVVSMYDARWQRARAAYLREHPLCVPCQEAGRTEPATVVHHKTPHRGDMLLFWDTDNWQGRCRTCHDDAAGPEATGRAETYRGCDLNGEPLDPKHRWNAANA